VSDPIPLRDAVAAVGRDLGLPDPDVLARLTAAWSSIVGPSVADHAVLRSVRDGVATVAVDGPVWATELRYREGALVDALCTAAGTPIVRAVRVVVTAPGKSLG